MSTQKLTHYQAEPYPEQHLQKPMLVVQTIAPKQRPPLAENLHDRPKFVTVTAIVRREVADALESLQATQTGNVDKFDPIPRGRFWRGEIFEVYVIEHIPAAFGMTFVEYCRRRYQGATLRDLKLFAKSVFNRLLMAAAQ